MAKITINADTDKKALQISVNGKIVENPAEAIVYHLPETEYSTEKVGFEVVTFKEEDGVKSLNRVYASKNFDEADIKNIVRKNLGLF